MIFLKWEEPVEPNGLITQYEVGSVHSCPPQRGVCFIPRLRQESPRESEPAGWAEPLPHGWFERRYANEAPGSNYGGDRVSNYQFTPEMPP